MARTRPGVAVVGFALVAAPHRLILACPPVHLVMQRERHRRGGADAAPEALPRG